MKGLELLVSHKDEKKYVLIIGCGRLGASLANEIYSQGNDVCILDRDRELSENWIPLMEAYGNCGRHGFGGANRCPRPKGGLYYSGNGQ